MVRKKFRAELTSGFTVHHLSKAWSAVLQLPTHLHSKVVKLIQSRHWTGMSFAERSCSLTQGQHQLNYNNNPLIISSITLFSWDK